MKNSTSLLFKLFLFILILLINLSVNGLEFDPHDSHLVSHNTVDGRAVMDFERFDGETEIAHNLYLQAKINGSWTTIWHYNHYMDDGNKYRTRYRAAYVSVKDRGRVDQGKNTYVEQIIKQ